MYNQTFENFSRIFDQMESASKKPTEDGHSYKDQINTTVLIRFTCCQNGYIKSTTKLNFLFLCKSVTLYLMQGFQ